MEDRFPSEGLAPPWRMAYSSSLARTTEPFDLKASGRLAGTAYSCSPTQHVLPAGPASPSRMGLFVGPGWAAPSMPHAVLAPFLYHPVWHRITEGAVLEPGLRGSRPRVITQNRLSSSKTYFHQIAMPEKMGNMRSTCSERNGNVDLCVCH